MQRSPKLKIPDNSEMRQHRRKSTFYFRNHFWVLRKVSDVMHALQTRSCKQSESCGGLKARDIDGPPLDFYSVLLSTARGAKTVDKSQVAASFGFAQPSHFVGSLNLREIVDRIVRIVGIEGRGVGDSASVGRPAKLPDRLAVASYLTGLTRRLHRQHARPWIASNQTR